MGVISFEDNITSVRVIFSRPETSGLGRKWSFVYAQDDRTSKISLKTINSVEPKDFSIHVSSSAKRIEKFCSFHYTKNTRPEALGDVFNNYTTGYYKCNCCNKTLSVETTGRSFNKGVHEQFNELLDGFSFSKEMHELFAIQLKN